MEIPQQFIDILNDIGSNGLATRVGEESWYSYIPGIDYGPQNAYKHILLAAELTRIYGEETARQLLDLHEWIGNNLKDQTPEQEAMDRHNNEIGIEIGNELRINPNSSWEDTINNARQEIDPSSNGVGDNANWLPESEWKKNPPPEKIRWPNPHWSEIPDSYPTTDAIPPSIIDDIKDFVKNFIPNLIGHIGELVDDFYNAGTRYVNPRRDPLTLGLDGDGLETVGTAAGILFDHDADGIKNGTGWVSADDGFLVWDKNGNNLIDNGRELFGDAFIKGNGQTAVDGFDALRSLDSNGNGKIDSGDTQFNNLKVWRDLNQNGTTQTGELFTLNQLGIASINVNKTENSQTLANGNQIADLGTYTRTDGSTGVTAEVTGNLADINLATDNFHRQFTTQFDTSAVVHLPDMQGSGAVRDLREAASQSPALAATLSQLNVNTSRAELKAAVDVILRQWADGAEFTDSFEAATGQGRDLFFIPPGVSALDAYNAHYHGLLGTYYTSTAGGAPSGIPLTPEMVTRYAAIRAQQDSIERMVKTLDAFNGRDFVQIGLGLNDGSAALTGITVGIPSSSGVAFSKTPAMYTMEQERLDLLTQSYNQLTDSVYTAIVTQTRLKPYLDAISLQAGTNGISFDLSAMDAMLETKKIADPGKAYIDLLELYKYTGNTLASMSWEAHSKLLSWVDQVVINAEIQGIFAELNVKVSTGSINGASDAAILIGQSGNDVINGGNGNDLLGGKAGNDFLFGGAGNDILDGGAGNDNLDGGLGDDTYLFGRGDGQDRILSDSQTTTNKLNTLQFKPGVAPSDILLTPSSTDLVLSIAGTTDQITLINYYGYTDSTNANNPVQLIKFSDGTSWDIGQVMTMVMTGNEAAQNILGSQQADTINALGGDDSIDSRGGDDTIDGGAGNDSLWGGSGSDTFLFGRGDGQDLIRSASIAAGEVNTLQFKPGIAPSDIVLSRPYASDLVVMVNINRTLF